MLFFSEFSCRGPVSAELGPKIFFSPSHPISSLPAKNNAGKKFFNFLNFFENFFSEFSFRGRVWKEFGAKIFVLPFSAYLIPFWLKIMPERGFLIFWIFMLFFPNFLARVQYQRNSGLKYFSPFPGLSHPVLARNIAWKRSFNFLNFFAIFFGIFLPGSSMNGIRD